MIIVADSGSTKCDWVRVKGKHDQEKCSTMGFNPFFHSTEFIAEELRKHPELIATPEEVTHIYYYGAGCSSEKLCKQVETALASIFTHAHIQVRHDLDGAAYATFEHQDGIACILGTGSNSCFVAADGTVTQKVPALGYILGDEGSGSYFGKKLISYFLYEKLPLPIHQKFAEKYGLTKEEVFKNVYMRPNSNVYLASFMRFLSDNRNDDFVRNFIYKGFSEFITTHIWKYENYREVPVHFVGSVAHYFQDLLREEARIHHLTIGNIVKQPIWNLVEYHSLSN